MGQKESICDSSVRIHYEGPTPSWRSSVARSKYCRWRCTFPPRKVQRTAAGTSTLRPVGGMGPAGPGIGPR